MVKRTKDEELWGRFKRHFTRREWMMLFGGFPAVLSGGADTIAPTCVITCDQASPTAISPITFTYTWSEDVTGFAVGDAGIANGTKGTFTAVSASVYTLSVTPDAFGDVTATVAAGVCTDGAGNANEEATPLVIFYGVFDPAGMGDGALPAPWDASTYAIATEKAVGTPTEGAEMLTDGGMETWTSSTDLTNWTESVAGTSTINQDGTEKRSGSYCARMDIDASNSAAEINRAITGIATKTWIVSRAYAKSSAASGKTANMRNNNQTPEQRSMSLTDAYQLFFQTSLVGTTAGATIRFISGTAASTSIYIDDASTKTMTLRSLMALIEASENDVTVKGAWNIAGGSLAGVVMNVNDITTPTNFVLLMHNGGSSLYLFKCVNGTYTQVAVSAVTAYVAGANIELRKTAATTYQMWYNGSQVGADQTINEATINNNTIHGVFSTWGGNSLNRFFVG